MSDKGKLIVIEGLDGSGKSTQLELLFGELTKMNRKVERLKFPDYESKSSTLVKMYLNGELGGTYDVNPYAASAFYAADRYISFMNGWKTGYDSGTVYLADRYTTSNIIYQMTKLPKNEWEGYIDWLCDFEFDKMKLPQPDAVLYLDMPPALSRILLNKRYESGGGKMDIHETDSGYLEKCREAALYAADKLGWLQIHCATGLGEQQAALAVDKISQKILEIVLRII